MNVLHAAKLGVALVAVSKIKERKCGEISWSKMSCTM
jgi:hypothetical protein